MTMNELLQLPWRWRGPSQVQDAGEDPHFELQIEELPEFFVAGATREEVLAAARPALRAFLQSYLDRGEEPPMPAGRTPSWLIGGLTMPPQSRIPEIRAADELRLTS
jgi:predicted RNase H-like HicB family nuclease